jgi:hypothetical protein
MAGLVPAIHVFLSKQRIVKILPLWIHPNNESDLPRTWPMFHVVLSLDRSPNVVMELVVNEHFQTISVCESLNLPCSVLPGTLWQLASDTSVKGAVRPVCLNVNPAATHADSLKTWMAGTSPAMTWRGGCLFPIASALTYRLLGIGGIVAGSDEIV